MTVPRAGECLVDETAALQRGHHQGINAPAPASWSGGFALCGALRVSQLSLPRSPRCPGLKEYTRPERIRGMRENLFERGQCIAGQYGREPPTRNSPASTAPAARPIQVAGSERILQPVLFCTKKEQLQVCLVPTRATQVLLVSCDGIPLPCRCQPTNGQLPPH